MNQMRLFIRDFFKHEKFDLFLRILLFLGIFFISKNWNLSLNLLIFQSKFFSAIQTHMTNLNFPQSSKLVIAWLTVLSSCRSQSPWPHMRTFPSLCFVALSVEQSSINSLASLVANMSVTFFAIKECLSVDWTRFKSSSSSSSFAKKLHPSSLAVSQGN